MSKCKDCPHDVGDSYERDCSFPNCIGWTIIYNPKSIPIRNHDWDFVHNEYDFCTETGDNGLCGTAKSYDDAIEKIVEIEEERSNGNNCK